MSYGEDSSSHLGGYWIGGDPNTWCPEVWERIIDDKELRSVLDVGCGEGWSTAFFADPGIVALGVEGAESAITRSPVPNLVLRHDYTTEPFIPHMPFDLVWCCEFVEHVEERFSANFMATFSMARWVAMTHAFPGQPGYHHVNCQSTSYWINRMDADGFRFDEKYSLSLRGLTRAMHVCRSLPFFANVRI